MNRSRLERLLEILREDVAHAAPRAGETLLFKDWTPKNAYFAGQWRASVNMCSLIEALLADEPAPYLDAYEAATR